MITTTWAKLNERAVHGAFEKLANASNLDSMTAYRVSRFLIAADKAVKEARVFEQNLAKKHVKIDEKGAILRDETGFYVFNEGGQEAYEKEFTEKMQGTEVHIKVLPLSWISLGTARVLSPAQIVALEDFITDLPDAEAEVMPPSNLILPKGVSPIR